MLLLLLVHFFSCAAAGLNYPSPQLPRNLHKLMNEQELNFYFGSDPLSRTVNIDYEVVYIHQHSKPPPFDMDNFSRLGSSNEKRSENPGHYSFRAHGKDYNLRLRQNNFLARPNLRTVIKGEIEEILIHDRSIDCHYLQVDNDVTAALSHCSEFDVRGFIIEKDQIYQVQPLTPRLRELLHPGTFASGRFNRSTSENGSLVVGPHIIRVSDPLPDFAKDHGCSVPLPGIRISNRTEAVEQEAVQVNDKPEVVEKRKNFQREKPAPKKGKSADHLTTNNEVLPRQYRNKVLELSIFVDQAACALYLPYFQSQGNNKYIALREFVLAFVNAMQALYHQRSLGTTLDLSIVYMEFHAKEPAGMPSYKGERSALLTSFCNYQKSINRKDDRDNEHWDMALLLSGLDFFAVESKGPNYVTMGLSTVTGVCTDNYNCVIGELGVVNNQGQPYPSTGFTSVYVMAHEIGHNLGMSHDSTGNSCPAEGYIMSPTRGVVGETTWSSCSASVMKSLTVTCMDDIPYSFPNYSHRRYGNVPGQIWIADDQCRILLRDLQAYALLSGPEASQDICSSMRCKTPSRNGFFISGPALEGTVCAPGKWCIGGACVPMGARSGNVEEIKGGWSDWKDDPCQSGCVEKSKGAVVSRRFCDNPKPVNTWKSCQGASTKIGLCDDSSVCPKRISAKEYATKQCEIFQKYVLLLDPSPKALQAAYSKSRPWQSCAIFCKVKGEDSFYTPRIELNNLLDVNAFYPDGTWCGNEGGKDMYCRQRVCIAQDHIMEIGLEAAEDISFNFLNSAPLPGHDFFSIPASVKNYFSINSNGQAVQETIDTANVPIAPPGVETGYADTDFITIKP